MKGCATTLASENITVAVVRSAVPMLLQNATKERYDWQWILTAFLRFWGAHVRAPHAARYAKLFAVEILPSEPTNLSRPKSSKRGHRDHRSGGIGQYAQHVSNLIERVGVPLRVCTSSFRLHTLYRIRSPDHVALPRKGEDGAQAGLDPQK